ncbi:uncharacterized protein LOC127798311 [Diospyros lotus]|uniref:uncharacterized protein LOC127798311 n=1 Tax=Diospyros lotus TaxID=55363 RepID=UPI00224E36A6|nr:uncharacterized protein LOC127798311 [Diospyros lotus]
MAPSSRPSFSFSLLLLSAASLLLAGGADAKFKGINNWCKTADYRQLCTDMVKAAETQDEALANAVQSTYDATVRVLPLVDALGTELTNLQGETKTSVIDTCKSSFDDALDNLKEALTYMAAKDMHTAIDRIQTAEGHYYDCSDAIKQMGGNAESLSKASKVLYKYGSNCMAVATQT